MMYLLSPISLNLDQVYTYKTPVLLCVVLKRVPKNHSPPTPPPSRPNDEYRRKWLPLKTVAIIFVCHLSMSLLSPHADSLIV